MSGPDASRHVAPTMWWSDIRGILHAHTDSSDGVNTLAEKAEASRTRGYEYFGVADHSKSAHYAVACRSQRLGRSTKRSTA